MASKQLLKYQDANQQNLIEKTADWILKGVDYYGDEIEVVGDWVYLAIYLPTTRKTNTWRPGAAAPGLRRNSMSRPKGLLPGKAISIYIPVKMLSELDNICEHTGQKRSDFICESLSGSLNMFHSAGRAASKKNSNKLTAEKQKRTE